MLRRRFVLGRGLACVFVAAVFGACGSTRERAATAGADEPTARTSLTTSADGYLFTPGGRMLARYERGARGLKPYLASWLGADGVELLRDAPADHEHHHGLMFALGVDDVDFWGERYADVPGRQVERTSLTCGVRVADAVASESFVQVLEWLDPRDDSVRLVERRELELELEPLGPGDSNGPRAATARLEPWTLTWRSRLAPGPGRERVRLWGRPYFGLGLRLAAPFDHVARFVHSDGTESELVRGDERLTLGRWCAITADVAGTPRTLALFASPTNPRATRFFTMAEPFAYLAATLDLAREPVEPTRGALWLTRDAPLGLTYALCVWERDVTPHEIDQHYAEWTARTSAPVFGSFELLEAFGAAP